MDNAVPVLLLFIFFLTIFWYLKLLQRKHKNVVLPRGPRPWPLLGNLVSILTNKTPLHLLFMNMARPDHGGLTLVRLGRMPLVIVSNKEAAMEVLKTHDRALSGRIPPSSLNFPERIKYSIVWSDCTDNWRLLRRILRTEIFSPKMLKIQEQVREQKVRELMDLMRSREGQVVTIRPLVFRTISNIVGNAVFSTNVSEFGCEKAGSGSHDDDKEALGLLEKMIRELLFIGSTPDFSNFFEFLGWVDPQGLKKQARERLDKVDKMWEPIVKERRSQLEQMLSRNGSSGTTATFECKDMLDVLLTNNFNDSQINLLLLETIGTASETSSATVEWVMAELMKHPETMSKVRQELDNESKVTGTASPSHCLTHLPYLNAVIRETMRLHPAIPIYLPHRAVETCQVLGYTIPQDFLVIVNAYAIGRDPKTWKDPTTFRPERFLESDIDYQGNHFEFVPFGAGRRICPGLPLAVQNIRLIVSSLIQGFDWSLPGDDPPEKLQMNEQYTIALNIDPSLSIVPRVRDFVA